MNDYSEAKCRKLEAELVNLGKRLHRGRPAAVSPTDAETCERAALLLAQYRLRLASEIVTDLSAWYDEP